MEMLKKETVFQIGLGNNDWEGRKGNALSVIVSGSFLTAVHLNDYR
jgi:hypothetical protein